MVFSVLAALAAALCYGVGTVLQALGARRTAGASGLDPRVLTRALRQWPFVLGTGLDLAGYACQFVALRELPIFAVEAAQSANLAVTAVLAVPVLGARLRGPEWGAVAAVCAGLALLGVSAGHEGPAHTHAAFHWSLLACVAALGLAGWAAARLAEPWRSRLLGLLSGLGFGLIALATRVLTDLSFPDLLASPTVYALVIGAALTFLLYTIALQGGAVTSVAAALVVGETVLPAGVGIVFLGDHSRPGPYGPLALTGFVCAVAGAIALSRFAEGEPDRPG
ncbi:DMT family transporter [Embleya sp. NPDC059237]|uniref:DMT family transporter n=1 Tax=Embleya sp. NPDC059237 TaxID=3346784 RepID=UPI00368731E1